MRKEISICSSRFPRCGACPEAEYAAEKAIKQELGRCREDLENSLVEVMISCGVADQKGNTPALLTAVTEIYTDGEFAASTRIPVICPELEQE
jgi:hypothetical protein